MAIDWIRKCFFLLAISSFGLVAGAQQPHFIYVQTDNGDPFYVKINQKIVSSSSEGFVILPNLESGTYDLKIGFPKNEHPETEFQLNVDTANEGYVLKNFEDKGFQLFNLQSLALIAGTSAQKVEDTVAATVTTPVQQPDAFTKMLADVVKDSSILENHRVVVNTAAKPDSAKVVADSGTAAVTTEGAKDSSLAMTGSGHDTTGMNKVVIDQSVEPRDSAKLKTADLFTKRQDTATVAKIMSHHDEQGLTLAYRDSNGNVKDTVNVFMPAASAAAENAATKTDTSVAQNNETKKSNISSFTDTSGYTITPTVIPADTANKSGFVMRKDSISSHSEMTTAPTQVFVIGPEKNKKSEARKNRGAKNESQDVNGAAISDVKIIDANKSNPEAQSDESNGNKIEVLPKVVTSSTVNSDCKNFATNEDFLRLRKKMAGESNDEAMIRTAKKYFRSRCYSTAQIKDLSYLFLTNEGKYMFFDAAYPYTSDSDQYETLESQLTDEYYLNRFKAMLRK